MYARQCHRISDPPNQQQVQLYLLYLHPTAVIVCEHSGIRHI